MTTNRNHVVRAGLLAGSVIGAATLPAVAEDMEKPEMRVWSTALGEPREDGSGLAIRITASASPHGSNSLVIENVAVLSTKTAERRTEVTGMESCDGPYPIEGGSFASPEPESEGEDAPAIEKCAFSISGKVHHTYRPWPSWDFKGTVTQEGDSSVGFAIEDPRPAMLVEPADDAEKAES